MMLSLLHSGSSLCAALTQSSVSVGHFKSGGAVSSCCLFATSLLFFHACICTHKASLLSCTPLPWAVPTTRLLTKAVTGAGR